MQTDCNPALFEFPPVGGRDVVASFDGGAITSDAGALLLGQTDRAIRLTERFASCFADTRTAELVEHPVETMVMQRVVGIALGYEDLNDHDQLRRDPVLAVLAGKLEAQRSDCAPLAGKSTLNRLELSRAPQGASPSVRNHRLRGDGFQTYQSVTAWLGFVPAHPSSSSVPEGERPSTSIGRTRSGPTQPTETGTATKKKRADHAHNRQPRHRRADPRRSAGGFPERCLFAARRGVFRRREEEALATHFLSEARSARLGNPNLSGMTPWWPCAVAPTGAG